ncbi:MAG: Ig-like domain-containing protein [Eubacteriales bacterium]
MKLLRLTAMLLCTAILCPFLFACGTKRTPVLLQHGDGFPLQGKLTGSGTPGSSLPAELCNVTVTADNASGRTVPCDTAFSLKFASPTTEKTVAEYLRLSPDTALKVTRLSDTEYRAVPEGKLDPDTVYRLSLGKANAPQMSFAFQTESVFRLRSTIPADLATAVPVNTGIELDFSSALATGTDLSDYITIEPALSFRAELYPNGRTLALIPSDYLKENTEYTVRIASGLLSAAGETLAEGKTIRFRTEAKSKLIQTESYYLSLEPDQTTVTPGNAAQYSFYFRSRDDAVLKNVTAEIYRYPSPESLADAIRTYLATGTELSGNNAYYVYPTAGMTRVAKEKLIPQAEAGSRLQVLTMPLLENGAYLVNLTVEIRSGLKTYTEKTQQLIQVTPLSAYTEYTQNELLIWTEEEQTSVSADFFRMDRGFSVKNEAASYTTISAECDENGIAKLSCPENTSAALLTVSKGESTLLLPVGSLSETKGESRRTYVFTDREVYFGDDVIRFSGFLLPGIGELPFPDKLWLQVSESGAKYPVKIEPDGSFSGSYTLEGIRSYSLLLRFVDADGNTVVSRYVSITADSKPVYTAALSFDRLFYRTGDTAVISVSASFFDGTPAPGLTFRIRSRISGGSTTSFDIVTDETGVASISYRLPAANAGSTAPISVSAAAELIGNETTTLYLSASAPYLHSDFYFTAGRTEDGKAPELRLNRVDTSALQSSSDLLWSVFPQNTVGTAMEGTASVKLYKVSYVRRSTGTTYDAVSKLFRENYTYDRLEELVSTEILAFRDGKIRLKSVTADKNFNGYYYYSASFGRYTLTVSADGGNMYRQVIPGNVSLASDKELYRTGETMTLSLNDGPEPVSDRRCLVTVTWNGGRIVLFTDDGTVRIPYEAKYINGLNIYFTFREGAAYRSYNISPGYEYADDTITLTLTTDKDSYKPGETVSVRLSARRSDGSPATGIRICLAVVDEACFALGDQLVEIQRQLYESAVRQPAVAADSRFSLFCNHDFLYRTYALRTEAECADIASPCETGGTNGENSGEIRIRSLFSNTPVFEGIRPDQNGQAVFTFTAPDNVTTWRLTAIAVDTADLEDGIPDSGCTTGSVVSTLPFFLNVSCPDTYIVGDDITVSARVYGSEATSGTQLSCTAELLDENGKILARDTASGKVGTFLFFSFGKQKEGSYRIRVTARTATNADAVETGVTVVRSAVLANITKLLTLEEIGSITPAKYPVSLTFFSERQKGFLELAGRLSRGGASRSDIQAAAYVASMLFNAYCGTDAADSADSVQRKSTLNSSYVNGGLISLLPYSQGDLKLSALLAACCPDALTESTKDTLRASFENTLKQKDCTEEELVYSLLGLAGVGAPVLTDLCAVASACSAFSTEGKLILAAAFAVIGDYPATEEVYSTLRGELFHPSAAEHEAYFAPEASSTEDRLSLTAAALLSASVVAREDAALYVRYLSAHTSRLDSYNAQLAFYLSRYIPSDSAELTFSCVLGDEEKTVTLRAGEAWNITLTKSELASFSVRTDSKDLRVLAGYTGDIDEAVADTGESEELEITKTTVSRGNGIYLVTVSYRITTDRTNACFTISDTIPSGARYLRENTSRTGDKYSCLWLSNSGQTMSGVLCCWNPNSETAITGLTSRTYSGSFSYSIRTAIPGEYISEAAVARNTASGSYAVSQRETLILK